MLPINDITSTTFRNERWTSRFFFNYRIFCNVNRKIKPLNRRQFRILQYSNAVQTVWIEFKLKYNEYGCATRICMSDKMVIGIDLFFFLLISSNCLLNSPNRNQFSRSFIIIFFFLLCFPCLCLSWCKINWNHCVNHTVELIR